MPAGGAALYPAVAEAARRLGAAAIGLVDLGGGNLDLDGIRVTYSSGLVLGDPAAPEPLSSTVRGDRPIPATPLPPVVARSAVGPDPAGPLADAIAPVPEGAVPIVTTTWALSRISPARRRRFVAGLEAAAAERTLAWVSVEGVGVAPGIPTLGDRPASGHSIIGLATFDGPAEALGRCWSRGRWLSWLADG